MSLFLLDIPSSHSMSGRHWMRMEALKNVQQLVSIVSADLNAPNDNHKNCALIFDKYFYIYR